MTCVYADATRANESIDPSLRRGERFCLLGPNGAGKSTRIRPVVALLRPSLAAELMSALWHGGTLLDPRLALLAAWCAGFVALASRLVPWTDRV